MSRPKVHRNRARGSAVNKHRLLIVGAGLNGLAAAYESKKAGAEPVILDSSGKPAAEWRSRHDQLRLNTYRRISHLPGMRIPRSFGAFPSRDDMVRYLEDYEAFVAALKAGWVTVLPEIERFEGDAVRFIGEQTVIPDVVICATGYSPGLESLVGHLPVLNAKGKPIFSGPESHPEFEGLWFMGMKPRLPGVFYAARGEARRIAAKINKNGVSAKPP